MDIDNKKYEFNQPISSIKRDEITSRHSNLEKIFSAFDTSGDKILNTKELKNIFNTINKMDNTNNVSDNKLTDDEIQRAIKNNDKLKNFSVAEIKLFIKTVTQINNSKINEVKKQSTRISRELVDQISGPSLNKNTVEKLKNINSSNAYYVLTQYKKDAKGPLVQALGEEWNFNVNDVKNYVLRPLIAQAQSMGIEVSKETYENENNFGKLNDLAEKICNAIGQQIKNPKFGSNTSVRIHKATQASAAGKPSASDKASPAQKSATPKKAEKPHDIANQIYEQISGPSLNKNTIDVLEKINESNAAQVITEYKKIAGESLADAIDNEWGLDIDTIKKYVCTPLMKQAKAWGVAPSNIEDRYKNITSMESINKVINELSSKIIVTANNTQDVPQKINFKDYTLQNLQKKYPDKLCRQVGNIILIKNKDGSAFMEVRKKEDGRLLIYDKYNKEGEYTRYMVYKPDGTLDYFITDGKWRGRPESGDFDVTRTDLNNKVNELFEDIYHKVGGIFPGTRKSLGENIAQIDVNNILEIMALYQSKTGESLFDAIDNEVGLGDDRKVYIDYLNKTLDRVFSSISGQNVILLLSDFSAKTDMSLLDTISKDSGMPKDKQKAFIDKINQKLQNLIKELKPDNIEEVLTKYKKCGVSITEVISKESGLPESLKKSYINSITKTLSEHIKTMNIYDYAYNKVKDDYDDVEGPTLTALIASEKSIPPAEKVKLITQLENRLIKDYLYDDTATSDIQKQIEKELEKITRNPESIDVELLDKLNSKLYNRDTYYSEDSKKQKLKAPNGKIDNIAYQGGTGDCWLLAAINAIARSKKGLQMLNNSLKVNSDGSVTVHLNGVNKSYTISKKDLYAARELSTGDLDVRAIEIAFERYMMEYRNDDINGNSASVAFDVLIGGNKKVWTWTRTEMDDDYKNKINNPDVLVTASISSEDRLPKGTKTTSGQEIYANHAYTVVKADNKYVYLINPWDNGQLIKLSYSEFKSIFDQFSEVEM